MDIPLTQRAYTLRLSGDDQDHWRDALWQTHEAVNRGAKVFGDWLLTLRGGLCHTVTDAPVPQGTGKPGRPPAPEELRDRRVVLSLSWLSVESEHGAPAMEYQLAGDQTIQVLRTILQARGVADQEIESWVADCGPSLAAAVREDAVWVNRSRLFDEVSTNIGISRPEAQEIFFHFFGPAHEYLQLPSISAGEEEAPVTASGGVSDTKFATIARGWLSSNWGAGKKTDSVRLNANLQRLATEPLTRFEGIGGRELVEHLVFSCDKTSWY